MCYIVHVCSSEDNRLESILSFYHVCPKHGAQVVRLGYTKQICLNNFYLTDQGKYSPLNDMSTCILFELLNELLTVLRVFQQCNVVIKIKAQGLTSVL